MNIKIFCCNHQVPDDIISTEIFQTFISGVEASADYLFYSDLSGEGIPYDNRYSEMRHQFFVWKNLLGKYDSVGFEHYRRLLFLVHPNVKMLKESRPELYHLHKLSTIYATHHFLVNSAVFKNYIIYRETMSHEDSLLMKGFLADFDIVTVRPTYESVQKQWTEMHGPESWARILNAVCKTEFAFRMNEDIEANSPHQAYYLNMYVMKSDIFKEYMEFAFEALRYYEGIVDAPVAAESRLFGHITERLFSIYILLKRLRNPNLKVLELPVIWRKTELDPEGETISHDFRFDLQQAEKRGREASRKLG